MPPPRNRLDDPGYAAFAWARYRRILKWMALAALLAVLAALAWIRWSGAPMSRHLVIATALGVGLTVLCAGALMGLVFLSSGTGHDEDVGGGD
ncbi:MAG: hypothetical protein H7X93_08070 [Sphingomonadaceae bacterium]|nr:hypothetical protein [Sphingomonadaceae bacterium]